MSCILYLKYQNFHQIVFEKGELEENSKTYHSFIPRHLQVKSQECCWNYLLLSCFCY